MKAAIALVALTLLASPAASIKSKAVASVGEAPPSPCDSQCRFNLLMCYSFMCTDCTYEWCTESCQSIQSDFPGLRCANWPEARTSYSNGEFAGKGKLGDGGDYAEKQK
eukprot:TRINITY_DN334_c0_g1_i1.p1 TRINITY_DN334_c0_g1~~TRINITY_DN334_c0_g1_i1.p1  ORF type:complete len:109 (+),score=26.89 TRINITY_DN334_c0_g1_i1:253-579(+)